MKRFAWGHGICFPERQYWGVWLISLHGSRGLGMWGKNKALQEAVLQGLVLLRFRMGLNQRPPD